MLKFCAVTKRFPDPRRQRTIFRGLFSKAPTGAREIFRDYELEIKTGEKLLILGKNGIGKTTLLKLAGGYIRPDAGRVLYHTSDAHKAGRENFGCMMSTQLLYIGLTGYRNLENSAYLYRCPNPKQSIESAIEQWGIGGIVDDLVESLSNGKRSMLALARATIHNPAVILMDEPSAFLDKESVTRLRNFIVKSPATILVTTQDPEPLRSAFDRMVCL